MTSGLPEAEPARETAARPGRWWARLRGRLSRTWQRMQPGPRARRGAAWGAAVAAALLAGGIGAWAHPGLGPVWDVPAGILIGLLVAVLAGLVLVAALKLLALLPRFLGWAGAGAVGFFVFLFVLLSGIGFPAGLGLATVLALVAVHAALGGALALLSDRQGARPAWRRATLALVVLAALAADAWLVAWLADRGSAEHLVKVKRPAAAVRVAPLAAPDPSRPGPYRVLTLTYGSGSDRRRPEFGTAADLKTRPVDATPFLEGNEGWTVGMRERFWGFGFERFPLNGRVWHPDGPGPFPLVLVVHGNHDMTEFSDPGYAWLGELLASRGFLTVSVDENFFNGSWVGGLDKENDGRGWLLLKHLEAWRGWNRTPGNPFHRRVDMGRIALIGHSRGGEAAYLAAAFNRLPRYPDDATVPLGFGFGIRAVVAIAPSDGQYEPAGKPAPLAGVSYLVLQGGHDGDVSVFAGDRAYGRLAIEEGQTAFKAALYSYRSNHGQWNTVWGDADMGWPFSALLNREPLLPAGEQRRLGAVAISAFLEATLRGGAAYVRLFRDLRSARGWLPEDLYVTRFQDDTFRALVDSEEDVDVTTARLAGAAIDGRHLALWKQADLAFRDGEKTKENQVVYLGWKRDPAAPGKVATYTVRLPVSLPLAGPGGREGPGGSGEPAGPAGLAQPGGAGRSGGAAGSAKPGSPTPGWAPPEWAPPDARSLLVFSLADSGEEPPDPAEKERKAKMGKAGPRSAAEKKAEEKAEEEAGEKKEREREAHEERERKEGREPLDLSIELVAAGGKAVRLPLSRFRAVPVPLRSRFTKLGNEEDWYGDAWEPVLQTFELPLAAFAAADPAFAPSALREIRLVFDRSPEGMVILDDLGFARGAE